MINVYLMKISFAVIAVSVTSATLTAIKFVTTAVNVSV